MNTRLFATAVGASLVLVSCGGGGSSIPQNPAPAATPTAAPAPLTPASFHMSMVIPRPTTTSAKRSPRYLAPGAGAIAIYDGATLVYVANLALDDTPPFQTIYAKSGSTTVAFSDCSFTSRDATCDLTITTTAGHHAFDFVVYPAQQETSAESVLRRPSDTGSPPVFTGIISSEGELSANLSPGANPAQTLALFGVASQVEFSGLSEAAFNEDATFGFRILDSTNEQIVQPGNAYDNGPVTITASPTGIVTIVPSSIATPPATLGDQQVDVTCINPAGGDVTLSFNVGTHPTTAYASGLSYTTSNYTGATILTYPFTCDPESGGTIPITVNSHGKHA